MRKLILSVGLFTAALIGPHAVIAQNEYPFCLQSPAGALICTYTSLEQCRQAGVPSATCVPNPATTGQGGVNPTPLPPGPPGGGQYLPPPSR
jgi:Protein of unknown function (DUF3551)